VEEMRKEGYEEVVEAELNIVIVDCGRVGVE
jgi:hypothetical protein